MRKEPKMVHALFLVQFLAYTGMRLDEARQLKWEDIDFERGTILITGGAKGTKNLISSGSFLFSSPRKTCSPSP
jgi:integrase